MELTKLSKTKLLEMCKELGIVKYKSKKLSELVEIINEKNKTKNEIIKENDSIYENETSIKTKSYINDYTYSDLNNECVISSPKETTNVKISNSKIINEINQLFHNKAVKQEDRFNLLLFLLDNIKNNIVDEKYIEIINLIKNLDYTNCELIQEIFMTIGSKYTKYNLDQFYTPLTVSKFICNSMKTGDGYNAIDPAGGTGDLLLFYKGEKNIWDIDENALKLCKFNYELNKQTNYELVCKNSLKDFDDSLPKYSYCVMNPPFGSNTVVTEKDILNNFELGKGKKKQEIGILFLELGLKLLKENGILFIIVPSGYVGNGNNICSEMRSLILKNRLLASISLPENTFKRSGTGVNTYLLIIQKKSIKEPYNILISKVDNIGYNLMKKDTPLKYKIIKETGDIIYDEKGKPVLDNDLEKLYLSLCIFSKDNRITGIETTYIDSAKREYEFVNTSNLKSNIIDVKRYLNRYLNTVDKLKILGSVKLISFCKIVSTPTKIVSTKLYKYIDIGEINSPLYGYKTLYGWELPSRAKYTLKKYDILVSKLEGSMSYCVILDDNDNYISTNGVSVLRPNDMNSLYILFSNIMSSDFRCQHNAYLTGSIMASISDDDIGEFLIDNKTVDIETTKKILDTLEKLQFLRI